MPDYSLLPVDHEPDFSDASLVPVDHDPFSADGMIEQARTQLATQPERLPAAEMRSEANVDQQVTCGASPGHCSIGQAVGAIGDGAYSSLEGVGNAARFVGRSIGLYGADEIKRSDQEIRAAAEAIKHGGKLLMNSPEARSIAADAAKDAGAAYWRDEKKRYSLLGRAGFGLLTDLGPVAMIGDATRALEKGHNAIDALGKGIVGNRQP